MVYCYTPGRGGRNDERILNGFSGSCRWTATPATGGWPCRAAARPGVAAAAAGPDAGIIGNHWDGLQVFLQDGRVEMDSNAVEDTIRPLTLNRKNVLFARHDESAAACARIALLIQTSKMNGIDRHAYPKVGYPRGHRLRTSRRAHINQLLPLGLSPALH